MKPDFDYQSAPYDFIHCMNEQCKHAGKCLRRQMALRMPAERRYVTIVNPENVNPSGENCPNFKEDRLIRFAVGMVHLYDNLTYRDAAKVKLPIYNYFGRSMYYRARNRQRPITPDEQDFIRKVFRQHGIKSEPVFDEYQEGYDWES